MNEREKKERMNEKEIKKKNGVRLIEEKKKKKKELKVYYNQSIISQELSETK